MNFSIIIPLYNEADNINQLNYELLSAINELKKVIMNLKLFMLMMDLQTKLLNILKN